MTYRLPFMRFALQIGLAHGVSDAAAGLLVGVIIQHAAPEMNLQILEYNLLAFGLMPLAGLLFDRLRRPQQGAAASLLVTLAGLMLLPFQLNIAILLIGLGSAGLHAGGGSLAITLTPGRASAAGIFAAFGVVGLTLGGMASALDPLITRLVLVCLLALLSAAIKFARLAPGDLLTLSRCPSGSKSGRAMPSQPAPAAPLLITKCMLCMVVLVIAISLRSTGWVGAQTSVARYSSAALWVAVAAGLGKLAGGFAADRFGWRRFMLIALTGAGLLLVPYGLFFANPWLQFAPERASGQYWQIALMLGVLLLQSVTPLSVAAMGRALPGYPALAASLALGTAVLAGGLPFFILAGGWFGPVSMAITLALSALCYWFALGKFQPNGNPV